MSGQFGEGVSILLRRPATIHRPLTPSIDTDGCSERGRAPSSTIYRPLTPSIDTVESVFRPSRWRREDSVATPAYCLRESMSGGEGRASKLHHPDDVNVVATGRLAPRGSAGPGPSHHAASRLHWRSGVVKPLTGVLPCASPRRETGPGCMRPRSCAGKERVRRTLMLCPCSGISVWRDAAGRYCGGTGRHRT